MPPQRVAHAVAVRPAQCDHTCDGLILILYNTNAYIDLDLHRHNQHQHRYLHISPGLWCQLVCQLVRRFDLHRDCETGSGAWTYSADLSLTVERRSCRH